MPVPARFHGLRDRVAAIVDDQFAEPVRLSFMKSGSPDPDRPQMQIDALLRTGDDRQVGIDGGNGTAWRSKISSGSAELHINLAKYAGPAFVKGDTVRAISRRGEPVFEVLYVNDRDHTRLIVGLGQA